ncbi:unnamed protein product [Phaeothamnion confervicola]
MEALGVLPRIRTFSPILAECGAAGRLELALEVREKARANELDLGEREYLSLIKACTAAKDAAAFEAVMADYREDVLRSRSRESWDTLRAFFEAVPPAAMAAAAAAAAAVAAAAASAEGVAAAASAEEAPPASAEMACAAPIEVSAIPEKPAVSEGAAAAVGDAWRVQETTVAADGTCACCGTVLESIELSPADTERLLLQVESLVCTSDVRTVQWNIFKACLEKKGRSSFDYVVDGANVGYFKKMAAAAGELADHRQIDAVVGQLKARGKRALVVLHSRHLEERSLAPASAAIVKRFDFSFRFRFRFRRGWGIACVRGSGGRPGQGCVLFSWRPRCLSSSAALLCTAWLWRWLLMGFDLLVLLLCEASISSLSHETAKNEHLPPFSARGMRHATGRRDGGRWRSEGVLASCERGSNDDWYWLYAAAWLGGRTLVLTNDEMRDHHFSMLSHRSFNRWRERHQVRFNFDMGYGHCSGGIRALVTHEPPLYSKRIQRSPTGAGGAWHFPLEGSEEWLCVTGATSGQEGETGIASG